ncbi:hypothetical protein LLG95_05800 [bacterium]|nr:hypothetical protein [bacterium]
MIPRRHVLSMLAGWLGPALVAVLILLPLALYFSDFLRAPARTISLMLAPGELERLGRLFARTTALAILSATIALVLSVIVFAAAEPALARRRLWPFLFMLPLLVPGYFIAIAWIQWLGFAGTLTQWLGPAGKWLPNALYSIPGVALVMALKNYPLALGFIYIGWRSAGTSSVEVASVLMKPGRLWRLFLFGWIRPWLGAGWLIVLITALLDYTIPMLMRQHVFSVEIMTAFNVYYKPQDALALALPLLAVSLAGAAMLGRLLSRVEWPVMARRPCRLPEIGTISKKILNVCACAVAIGSFVLPLVLLMRMAGDWGTFAHVIAGGRDQIVTSISLSALATAAVLVFSAGIATRGLWRRGGQNAIARTLTHPAISAAAMLVLYALPGSVIAMAFIRFYNRPALGAIYDSGFMLPLGLAAVNLPVAWLIFHVRLSEIPKTLVELEALEPIPPARRWLHLILPMLTRPALLAAGLVFILCMNEVQTATLLVAPGQETMSVRAMTLLHYAPDRLVAAYCLTAWTVALVPVLILAALARLGGHFWRKLVPHHELD